MNELVNDGIELSKLEINTGFINRLLKKWLRFCQSLRNTNHVKESELASLFGKLKYEENLIDNIYETEKKKSFFTVTPLSTTFFSNSIVQDFQDSPDDEDDTSSSASSSKSSMGKNKSLVSEAYEWDEEDVSSDDNELTEVKVLMILANDKYIAVGKKVPEMVNGEQNPNQKKRIMRLDQLTENPSSYGQIDLVFVKSSTEDTNVSTLGVEIPRLSEAKGFILPNHDTGRILPAESQVKITNLSVVVTDSSVLSITINEPSSVPAKGNKIGSTFKINTTPAGKLKNVKTKDEHPLSIVMKELNDLKLQISKTQSSYSTKLNPQQSDIKKHIWYIDSGCSRHMTGVKSYLHKYVEQPGPKVVFEDDSTCITEGYGSINFNGIVFTKVTFVNGLKYNLVSISQLCNAKYIVQFNEKRNNLQL
ncbi:hypothetical protein Tco_1282637 [Tanacetum coccineum]